MKQYLEELQYIIDHGEVRTDRTNVGTIEVFGRQQRYNLKEGFPAITTKKLAWKSVVSELLWFIEGSSDERRLAEILFGTRDPNKTTIWTANANSDYWKKHAKFDGDCGRIYGKQLRDWQGANGQGVDQIKQLITNLKSDPFSRRHLITTWNPGELDQMALPPCHVMAQFHVNNNNELSCQLYQRSCDYPLGSPFNIASYSLLTHMLAHVCGFNVGELVYTTGSTHIYLNQIDGVKTQLGREPLPLPKLWLNPMVSDIDSFTMNDIKLIDYQHHDLIIFPFAV
jgi:thymidylate synthase